MPSTSGPNRPARTLLEQLIHERNQTLEEFAAYAETYAEEHGEPGTLSAGHLQRLVAGRRYDGRPLGRVRPSTARLLEHIFDTSISQLLSEPHTEQKGASVAELRERIHASARVDRTVISLLYKQLDAIRRLDRQLGSVVACDEVLTKIAQVAELLNHSLSPVTRHHLAALLAELHMLAGWQATTRKPRRMPPRQIWNSLVSIQKHNGRSCSSISTNRPRQLICLPKHEGGRRNLRLHTCSHGWLPPMARLSQQMA
jgi:hypothetical protein